MSGKVWIWDQEACCPADYPQAWVDGIPGNGDAVIVWGSCPIPPNQRPSSGVLIINAGASAFAALSREELLRRLNRAGVATASPIAPSGADPSHVKKSGWTHRRQIIVQLFQLTPLQATMTTSSTPSPMHSTASRILTTSDRLYRRAAKLAVRALYAAGLDCGFVEASVGDDGTCAITKIYLPAEAPPGSDGGQHWQQVWKTALASFASRYAASAERISSGAPRILLGADPEFLLVTDDNRVVPASRYWPDGHGVGCDAAVVGGQVRYPVAELRPSPAATPQRLLASLRELMLQAAAMTQEQPLRWLAGGMPVPGFALGGHIHLSGIALTGRLLRQLDSYVAFPLAMVEAQTARVRRPRYGALGDFRMQPHGGFEYRTPPSWLISPLVAKAALALTLLCALETDTLTYRPAEDEFYVQAYYSGDREELRRCLEPLEAEMAKTAAWPELASWIEPLLHAARKREQWDERVDFRAKWRLPHPEHLSQPR